MEPIVYAGHLALETIEDLENYLKMIRGDAVLLHPHHYHKKIDSKGPLSQINIQKTLQEAGLQYSFDDKNYHILKENHPYY